MVVKIKMEEKMGNYNMQYEDYYKSLRNKNYGGGSIYYTGYSSQTKKNNTTNNNRFMKRLMQELVGVFVMFIFVLTCKFIVTPNTQQAYAYAKNIVNKSYDYKVVMEKVQGLTWETVQTSTIDWLEKFKTEIDDKKIMFK